MGVQLPRPIVLKTVFESFSQMNTPRLFLLGLVAALLINIGAAQTGSAMAATTIYANGGDFGWPSVTNENEALGAANGSSANFANGGWLAFQPDNPFTNVDITLEFTGLTGTGTIRFYVGATNNNGWFSALTFITLQVTNGTVQIASNLLNNYCSNLGGCNVFIVQNISGQALGLDSADMTANLVAPSPEPATWSMMFVAFLLMAWRLKSLRRARIRAAKTSATNQTPRQSHPDSMAMIAA